MLRKRKEERAKILYRGRSVVYKGEQGKREREEEYLCLLLPRRLYHNNNTSKCNPHSALVAALRAERKCDAAPSPMYRS